MTGIRRSQKRSLFDRALDRVWSKYTGKKRARAPRELRAMVMTAMIFDAVMDPSTTETLKRVGDNFSALIKAAGGADDRD